MRLTQLQKLNGLTTAGVNCISSESINGNRYFYVGTNDALYVYEKTLQLRNCFKLENQGVSCFELKVGLPGSTIVHKQQQNDSIQQGGEQLQIGNQVF